MCPGIGGGKIVNKTASGSDSTLRDADGAVVMRRPFLSDAVEMNGDFSGFRESINDVDDDSIAATDSKLRTRHLAVEDDGVPLHAVGGDAMTSRAIVIVVGEALFAAVAAFVAHRRVQRSRQDERARSDLVGSGTIAIAFYGCFDPTSHEHVFGVYIQIQQFFGSVAIVVMIYTCRGCIRFC